jgi:tetratricopeptide (TPR) repeat protein
MGHFLVLNSYDDARQRFIAQDSLIMPDFPLPYEEVSERWWRDFNYVYVVIYPPEREAEVLSILGPHRDPAYSLEHAAEIARAEIQELAGRDAFFAWFNLGANLVGLGDYAGAAEAFDQAFAIYQQLSEDDRPYRVMWYRVEPYEAYYHAGRYQDVINLANTTFTWVGKPVLEESYYWRGMAYEALGEPERAVSDYRKASELNPYYSPPQEALQRLGAQTP